MSTLFKALTLLCLCSLVAHAAPALSWAELKQSEHAIEQAQTDLVEQHFTAHHILEASRTGGADASEFLAKADAAQKTMQATLDNHIQAEFSFFVEQVHALQLELSTELEQGQLGVSNRQREQLEKLATLIQVQHTSYLENLDQYGKPKDWKRGEAIRKFFVGSQKFFTLFQQYTNPLATPAQPKLKHKLALLGRKIKAALLMAPRIASILVELVRNRESTNEGGSPLIASINALVRTWTKAFNFQVEVSGKENIPTLREAGTVNILAPTHRDEIFDNMTMAALGTDDMYIFGAVDHFAPKIIGNLADRSHSFVVVGRGSGKPIDKIVHEVGAGGSRTIYIYPEGTVSAGIGETHPPRENFVHSLVLRLKHEGYKVNLIPITLMNSSRFLGQVEEPSQNIQRAVVHEPINDAMLTQLLRNGDEQAVSRVLRAIWLETLETNASELMGQLRTTAFKESLASYLSCEALLTQP